MFPIRCWNFTSTTTGDPGMSHRPTRIEMPSGRLIADEALLSKVLRSVKDGEGFCPDIGAYEDQVVAQSLFQLSGLCGEYSVYTANLVANLPRGLKQEVWLDRVRCFQHFS